MDATFLNKVANTEGVREWLGGEGTLDFSGFVSNPDNVALQDDCGVLLAEKLGPGLYEVHQMFLEEGRGFGVFEACREASRYMFVETDCIELIGRSTEKNRAARGVTIRNGFVKAFLHGEAEYLSLTAWTWLRTDDVIEDVGRKNSDSKDPTYNRMLGAFLLMCKAGNAAKGTMLFNRWARIVREPLIQWKA